MVVSRMVKNYAVIDKNGIVLNIIVWDGEAEFRLPESQKLVVATSEARIGGSYKDGVFSQ